VAPAAPASTVEAKPAVNALLYLMSNPSFW
jgi:hypothetical protein